MWQICLSKCPDKINQIHFRVAEWFDKQLKKIFLKYKINKEMRLLSIVSVLTKWCAIFSSIPFGIIFIILSSSFFFVVRMVLFFYGKSLIILHFCDRLFCSNLCKGRLIIWPKRTTWPIWNTHITWKCGCNWNISLALNVHIFAAFIL